MLFFIIPVQQRAVRVHRLCQGYCESTTIFNAALWSDNTGTTWRITFFSRAMQVAPFCCKVPAGIHQFVFPILMKMTHGLSHGIAGYSCNAKPIAKLAHPFSALVQCLSPIFTTEPVRGCSGTLSVPDAQLSCYFAVLVVRAKASKTPSRNWGASVSTTPSLHAPPCEAAPLCLDGHLR